MCILTLPVTSPKLRIDNTKSPKMGQVLWKTNPGYFGVVVESPHTENAFVTASPWSSNVLSDDIPWIVGLTTDEGGFAILGLLENQGAAISELAAKYKQLFPALMMYKFNSSFQTEDEVSEATEVIRNFYIGQRDISIETFDSVKRMFGDSIFVSSTIEALLRYNKKTYFYIYSHRNEHSSTELEKNSLKMNKPVHNDENISLFRLNFIPNELNPNDRKVSELMITLWTNFVTNGDPNFEGSTAPKWNVVQSNLDFFNIKVDPEVGSWDWQKIHKFWRDLKIKSDFPRNSRL